MPGAAELRHGQEARHPAPGHRGSQAGGLPAPQVRGPEAVLARRRREPHPPPRRGGAGRRESRRARGGHRDGPSRTAQCAGEHPRQAPRGAVRGVRGGNRRRSGLRRRQVPPGFLLHPGDTRRAAPSRARVQSLPPGDHQPRGGRVGPGPAGAPRRFDPRPGAAHPHSRRCRVLRPGGGDRDPEPLGDARLRHRRNSARGGEQPDRLHHQRPPRFTLDAVLHRCRQARAGADLPRQRQRRGGGGLRCRTRPRFPDAVQEGRGHRHDLLPSLRPQRSRRAACHPADDVQEDPHPAGSAQVLRGSVGGRRRGRARGAGGDVRGSTSPTWRRTVWCRGLSSTMG